MGRPKIIVTGAGGFIGRRVVERLAASGGPEILALVRNAGAYHAPPGVRVLEGSIEEPTTCREAVGGAAAVIHLAAATGKRRMREYERVNVEGTRRLLVAAKTAGVGRFIHVSTIAAVFPRRRFYPYALSKEKAEELVAASGLAHVIVRPTIVLGPGSPAVAAFLKLACGGRIIVFGRGTVSVQPVHVDDVAEALADLATAPSMPAGPQDLGGPEVLSMLDFLKLLRSVRGVAAGAVRHLPLGTAILGLRLLEPLLLPILPMTAGQLAVFLNDSTAIPTPWTRARQAGLRSLRRTLEESPRDG